MYPWYLLCSLGILGDFPHKYPLYRAYTGISHRGTLVGVHPTIPWEALDHSTGRLWTSQAARSRTMLAVHDYRQWSNIDIDDIDVTNALKIYSYVYWYICNICIYIYTCYIILLQIWKLSKCTTLPHFHSVFNFLVQTMHLVKLKSHLGCFSSQNLLKLPHNTSDQWFNDFSINLNLPRKVNVNLKKQICITFVFLHVFLEHLHAFGDRVSNQQQFLQPSSSRDIFLAMLIYQKGWDTKKTPNRSKPQKVLPFCFFYSTANKNKHTFFFFCLP